MELQDPINALASFLRDRAEQAVSLEEMSRFTGYSAFHLQRKFKAELGVTPKQFHAQCRRDSLKAKLRLEPNVTDALFGAGYGSTSRVYENAAETLGMTPRDYRRRGQGLAISYAIFSSRFGFILIAATDKGLCSLELADRKDDLRQRLRDEFPEASIAETKSPQESALAAWEAALQNYLQGQPIPAGLPIDLQGTAFQASVWRFLQTIPLGETRSYQHVAQAIGHPKATRAVARACASNRVALAIPCHRVIRGDGALGGYRWGMDRKEALLAAEKQAIA
jgi:AraC family transcriptional regulator, regulatory protein of adaptative response / methylated-DNA-[protein]-cysteine methyltransferase